MDQAELATLQDPAILAAIRAEDQAAVDKLALRWGKQGLPARAMAEQVHCRQRARNKLPDWYARDCLFDSTALEQCSSQATARYHACAFSKTDDEIIDCCAGLGVDALAFAAQGARVTAVELDATRAALLRYHADLFVLGERCQVEQGDGLHHLERQADQSCTLVFADPDRRPEGKRARELAAYQPPLGLLVGQACRIAERSLWKLAPGLPLEDLAGRFLDADRLQVVSVAGDCKEILVSCDHLKRPERPLREAVLLHADGHIRARFTEPEEPIAVDVETEVQSVICEPDPAIIRAGLVQSVAKRFGLDQLHPRVAFLHGASLDEDFPGRRCQVIASDRFDTKRCRRQLAELGISHANISCRHFPHKPNDLYKQLRLKAGGTHDLYCWRGPDEKLRFACGERL